MPPELLPPPDTRNKFTAHDLEVIDRDNPRSIFNLVPKSVQTAILKVPGEMFGAGEEELRPLVKQTSWSRMRINFWSEYNRAQMVSGPMKMTNVFGGVCSVGTFDKLVAHEPGFIAWLLCPPTDYMLAVDEGLNHGMDQIREILSMDNYKLDKAGQRIPNVSLLSLKVKIVEMLDERKHGAIVQKLDVNSRTLSVNIQSDSGQEESLEEIQKRIKDLEGRRFGGGDTAIEVREVFALDGPEVATQAEIDLARAKKENRK